MTQDKEGGASDKTLSDKTREAALDERTLGEILVDQNVISAENLETALKKQREQNQRAQGFKLTAYLLDKGILTKEALEEIDKKYQRNQTLGEAFVNDGVISRQQLDKALARKKQYEFLGETLYLLGYVDRWEVYERLKEKYSIPSFRDILIEECVLTDIELRKILYEENVTKTIVEVLVELGYLSVIQLHTVLIGAGKHLHVGDMLVEAGLISREQKESALEKQRISQSSLADILINDQLVSEYNFFRVLARQLAIEFQPLDEADIGSLDVDLLTNIINQQDASQYRVVPLEFEQGCLVMGLYDPSHIERVSNFDTFHKLDMKKLVLIREIDFCLVFERLYGDRPHFVATA